MFKESKSSQIIKAILTNEHHSQASLAQVVGVSSQHISQIVNGTKDIGSKMKSKLKELFPSYFDFGQFKLPDVITKETLIALREHYFLTVSELSKEINVSVPLINKCESGERKITDTLVSKLKKFIGLSDEPRVIQIPYKANVFAPSNCKDINNNTNNYFFFDTYLLKEIKDIPISINNLEIINVMGINSNIYNYSKVIIDKSIKEFIDNHIFLFQYKDKWYLQRVHNAPEHVQCYSLDGNHVFDINPSSCSIYGLILPNIVL